MLTALPSSWFSPRIFFRSILPANEPLTSIFRFAKAAMKYFDQRCLGRLISRSTILQLAGPRVSPNQLARLKSKTVRTPARVADLDTMK